MVKSFLGILVIAICCVSFGNKPKEEINWISFEELEAAYAHNPKPIIIDLYTGWCGWCKQMDRTTYKNEKLVAYVNQHYYAVKFDAESKSPVVFNGKKYKYSEQYKTNEVALYLSFNRLSYPNTIFLSSPAARPAPLEGYMKPKEMEAPLKYFAERKSEQETFVEFNRKLKKEW